MVHIQTAVAGQHGQPEMDSRRKAPARSPRVSRARRRGLARAADRRARELGVEKQITRAVCRAMEEVPARAAAQELPARDPRPERSALTRITVVESS